MSDENERVALVSGATSGIGLAVARLLAQQGHRVFIGSRDADNVTRTVKELTAEGLDVDGRTLDVRSAESIEIFVQAAVERFGTIGVLVNNAGRSGGGITADIDDDLWYDVVETNLNSVFRLTRAVLNTGGMRNKNRGRIINIASTAGKQGVVLGAPYSASKHGVVGFTKALGNELAPTGITVNAVCPGYIATEMVKAVPKEVLDKNIIPLIPLGRLGEPEEIARCVVFLASDDAGLITGSTLSANGGQVMV
jgi:ketoreductase